MEMTSATAMMTSFSPKTSQTNTSSGPSATSQARAVSSASVSRLSAPVSVASPTPISSSSVTPVPAGPPASQSANLISAKVAPASNSPKSASVDSPQFNLKQGAMNVQGLLVQEKFSSNKLDTAYSGANATIRVSSTPMASKVTQTQSVADFSNAQGSAITNVQADAAESEQNKDNETVKPTVAEDFASIYGDDSSDKQAVAEESKDEQAQAKQSGQSQVGASATDDADSKAIQAEHEAAKQQRQDAIRQQEQQNEQKTQQIQAAQIEKLSKRDAEVKSHEQAHASVGGAHAKNPSYTYEKGPDGRRYAVDGEVEIDVSVVNGDAQATLNKMMKVYSAAMAPVQPSMADIRVAAEALQKMNEAREQLSIERQQGVIDLDDADHIIGLGAKIKNAQGEEQASQLEPFKRTASDAKISVDGIVKTSDATTGSETSPNVQSKAKLAYQAFNSSVTPPGKHTSNINAYV